MGGFVKKDLYRNKHLMSITNLQVVPAVSGGRALHRVSARTETQPGEDTLPSQMKQMSIGKYICMVA